MSYEVETRARGGGKTVVMLDRVWAELYDEVREMNPAWGAQLLSRLIQQGYAVVRRVHDEKGLKARLKRTLHTHKGQKSPANKA